jgi:hypothetical protein
MSMEAFCWSEFVKGVTLVGWIGERNDCGWRGRWDKGDEEECGGGSGWTHLEETVVSPK